MISSREEIVPGKDIEAAAKNFITGSALLRLKEAKRAA